MEDIKVSAGELADLMIAWREGNVSEGRLVELTGIDRINLRNLHAESIRRADDLIQERRKGV